MVNFSSFYILFPSDHWSGSPSFALMEAIRCCISSLGQTYKDSFPTVFQTLRWTPAHADLSAFLMKLRRAVNKVQNKNILLLLNEFQGLSKESAETAVQVGPLCQSEGITADFLTSREPTTDQHHFAVTNGMVIELCKYRVKSNITWETVARVWWPKLFHCETPLGTIISTWTSMVKKHGKLRNEKRTEFMNKAFCVPQPKVNNEQDNREQGDDTDSDDDLDCFPGVKLTPQSSSPIVQITSTQSHTQSFF